MKLVELFHSFQGEGRYTGYPMTFIRITGCPVGCPFCDTDYNKGENWTLPEIVDEVQHRHVCITGGEPLVHPEIEDLFEDLLLSEKVSMIHIETSGCYELPNFIWRHRRFFWITVSPKGKFLGAKKNFLPQVLSVANERKWVYPSTPRQYIEATMRLPNTYIQPLSEVSEVNLDHIREAAVLAAELGLPLSIQLHKLVNWR